MGSTAPVALASGHILLRGRRITALTGTAGGTLYVAEALPDRLVRILEFDPETEAERWIAGASDRVHEAPPSTEPIRADWTVLEHVSSMVVVSPGTNRAPVLCFVSGRDRNRLCAAIFAPAAAIEPPSSAPPGGPAIADPAVRVAPLARSRTSDRCAREAQVAAECMRGLRARLARAVAPPLGDKSRHSTPRVAARAGAAENKADAPAPAGGPRGDELMEGSW